MRLPRCVDLGILQGKRRKSRGIGIQVADGRQHSAIIAIGVGIVTEPGMPKRIAVKEAAMFAIAFFQNDHRPLITLSEAGARTVLIAQRISQEVEAEQSTC